MDVKLVVFKPNGARKDITLREGTFLIGRQKDAQLRLPLPTVSRRHCEIVHGEDSILVRDLGSSNGTYCNEERLEAEHQLEPGDVISVGSCRFTVQIDGVPNDIDSLITPPPPPDLSETPPAPVAAESASASSGPKASAEDVDEDDDDMSDLDETVTKSAGLGSLLTDGITEESSVFDFDFDFDDDDGPKL